MPLNSEPTSALYIPRTLKKRAVYSTTLWIIEQSFPVIMNLENSTVEERVALKRFKTWYWSSTGKWLGGRTSVLRYLVGRSLADVIDVNNCIFNSKTYEKLMLQLLFSPVAGEIEGPHLRFLDPIITYKLLDFFMDFVPFHLENLIDMSIVFDEPLIIKTILSGSPNLKFIHLGLNINDNIIHLKDHAPNLEKISLDVEFINPTLRIQLEEELFPAFFSNMKKAEVKSSLESKKSVCVSFKSLNQLTIRCDAYFGVLSLFAQAICYCYPNIKFRFISLIAVPYDFYMRKAPYISAILKLEPSEIEDTWLTNVYSSQIQLMGISTEEEQFTDIPVKSSIISDTIIQYLQHATHLQLSLSSGPYQQLGFIAWAERMIEFSYDIPPAAQVLTHLSVLGSINRETDAQLMVRVFNQCPNMKVLSLTINVDGNFPLTELKPLVNLAVFKIRQTNMQLSNLTCCFSRFEHPVGLIETICNIHENTIPLVRAILSSAPNLEIVEIPYHDQLLDLVLRGNLRRVHTWCITGGNIVNLQSWINCMESIRRVVFMNHMPFPVYLCLKQRYWQTKLQICYSKAREVFPFKDLPSE
ncbi:uncharacterized protein [Palaemon carinicauda]|uniref:uncharacterized protein n=1 Tax=Palaemon carinicauda TaxID=392227 RepID=UPI0035B6381F